MPNLLLILLTPYKTHKDRYIKAHAIGFLKRLQELTDNIETNQ